MTGPEVAREHLSAPPRFVRTAFDLVVRPGLALRAGMGRVEGRAYWKPWPYFLSIFGMWWLAWTIMPPPAVQQGVQAIDDLHPTLRFLMEYVAPGLAVMTVFALTVGTWLVLRPWGFNLSEHFVANVYVFANGTLLVLLLFPLFSVLEGLVLMGVANAGVTMVYHPWTFSQIRGTPRLRDFPRAWVASIVGLTLFSLPFAAVLWFV